MLCVCVCWPLLAIGSFSPAGMGPSWKAGVHFCNDIDDLSPSHASGDFDVLQRPHTAIDSECRALVCAVLKPRPDGNTICQGAEH